MAIPNNLRPINANQINDSLQSLAGQVPNVESFDVTPPEILDVGILTTIIPSETFETGSIDKIREKSLGLVESYTSKLPTAIRIPDFFSLIPVIPIPSFPPKVPSFGKIKNYIETKIDRIKRDRQKASVRALKQELKQQKNPFEYRKQLKNSQLANIAKNATNRG